MEGTSIREGTQNSLTLAMVGCWVLGEIMKYIAIFWTTVGWNMNPWINYLEIPQPTLVSIYISRTHALTHFCFGYNSLTDLGERFHIHRTRKVAPLCTSKGINLKLNAYSSQ